MIIIKIKSGMKKNWKRRHRVKWSVIRMATSLKHFSKALKCSFFNKSLSSYLIGNTKEKYVLKTGASVTCHVRRMHTQIGMTSKCSSDPSSSVFWYNLGHACNDFFAVLAHIDLYSFTWNQTKFLYWTRHYLHCLFEAYLISWPNIVKHMKENTWIYLM